MGKSDKMLRTTCNPIQGRPFCGPYHRKRLWLPTTKRWWIQIADRLYSHYSFGCLFVLEGDRILVAIDSINLSEGVLSGYHVLCYDSCSQKDVPRRWKNVLYHNVMLRPLSIYHDFLFLIRRFCQHCDDVFAFFLH